MGPAIEGSSKDSEYVHAAGVDYVVVDMTNLPQYDQTADAIQLRPFEIMCEVSSDLTRCHE